MTAPDRPFSPEEWARLKQLFNELTAQPTVNRLEVLARLEQDEPSIVRELRRMLQAHATSDSVMNAAFLPAHPFGTYDVTALLGRGGMGDVFEARDRVTGRVAAIKCPPLSHADANERKRFDDEWRALAELQHPNIAQLYSADYLDDGTPWFAMERVKGEYITHYVWKRNLPLDVVLRLFVQLCEAVQFAHQKLIKHGDIKPSNVLVTEDGTVKLLDFSIANSERDGATAAPTQSEHFEGSVAYASLEQLRRKRPTAASDIHSLAVLLHELLSGRRPYELDALKPETWVSTVEQLAPPHIRQAIADQEQQNADEASAGIAPQSLKRPVAISSGTSEDWRDIDAFLAESLSSTSEDRYRTVTSQIADIRNLLEHRPLVVRQANRGYVARRFVRRNRTQALVAAIGLIALTVAGISYSRSATARRDAFVAQATNSRIRQFLDDLFLSTRSGSASAEAIRALTLVENGVKEAHALRHDAPLRKDMLETIGILSLHLDRVATAESLFKEASLLADSLYGADDPESIRPRVRLASVLSGRDQSDSALALLTSLEQQAKSGRHASSPALAEVYVAFGGAFRDAGKGKEAIGYLERARALRVSDTTSREYLEVLRELSNAYATIPDLRAADSVNRHTLPLVRERMGNRHPDVAFILANIGRSASLRGQLDTAAQYQREATGIIADWYGPDAYYTGMMYGNLAQTMVRRREYAAAESLGRAALRVFTNAADVGPDSRLTAIAHNTLGAVLMATNRYPEAMVQNQASLRISMATVGPTDRNTITNASNVANLLALTGAPDSAMRLFNRTLEHARATYGANNIVTAQVRLKMGAAYQVQGKFRDAITSTTAALPIVDSVLSPAADIAMMGRQTLIKSYRGLGDTTNASRVQAELEKVQASARQVSGGPKR